MKLELVKTRQLMRPVFRLADGMRIFLTLAAPSRRVD
jgi:hypothetical protein